MAITQAEIDQAKKEKYCPSDNAFSNWSCLGEDSSSKQLYSAISLMRCFIGNAELLKIAEHLLVNIRDLDKLSDEDRISCNSYRNEWVQQYNMIRETLVIRKWQKRYRGELLEILDFIPEVKSVPPNAMREIPI